MLQQQTSLISPRLDQQANVTEHSLLQCIYTKNPQKKKTQLQRLLFTLSYPVPKVIAPVPFDLLDKSAHRVSMRSLIGSGGRLCRGGGLQILLLLIGSVLGLIHMLVQARALAQTSKEVLEHGEKLLQRATLLLGLLLVGGLLLELLLRVSGDSGRGGGLLLS
ncbi:hypothetical protein QBC46DRAFT_400523 [Diplogelasinospora grovesii]|uniref:Uncharacterized protein n=1 Tax=Diplogelasinospora grovesii TaxID=303347 RepID=A0AAN6MVB9_9PEZI|nr:hypothetical protein QBC46DRAFT_400523 [Diplogelasinospora grovesii]